MAIPEGKRHGYWVANSGAQRDLIADADGLLVGDLCSIKGVMWHWNGVTWVVEGGGTNARYVSIADLGAIAGGDPLANADAYQAAIDLCAGSAVYSTVLIPGRTVPWNMGHEIQMKDGVRVLGEGPNSVVSFVGAAGSFTHDGDIWAQGSAAQIEEFDSHSNEGDREITVNAPPSAVAGDLVFLYQPGDNSWDDHSVHQRAGEFAEVESISGDDMITVGGRIDTYLNGAGDPDVYKVTPVRMTFENVTIIGRGADDKAALWIDYGRDLDFIHCKIATDGGHGLHLSRCFNVEVFGGELSRVGGGAVPHHAVKVEHCQEVLFRDVKTNNNTTFGACIFIGGADVEKPGAFPTRLVRILGGVHNSKERTVTLGRHTDLCEIEGGYHDGEVLLAGGRHKVHGTEFNGFVTEAIDASSADWHFVSFTVEGCSFNGKPGSASGRPIACRILASEDEDRRDNAIIIRNNKIAAADAGSNPGIEVYLNGDIGPRRIVIEDNEIIGHSGGTDYLIEVITGGSYGGGQAVKLEDISIKGNKLYEGGVWTSCDCPLTTIQANNVVEASDHAFFQGVVATTGADSHTVVYKGNTVRDCTFNPFRFQGANNLIAKVYIDGNTVDDWGSGTDDTKSPVHVVTCDALTVQGNTFAGGPGTNFPVCHVDCTTLYWGGNSFPEIGTVDIEKPDQFLVTHFWGDVWAHTEGIADFTEVDRDITWGNHLVSFEEAQKLNRIQFSHDVWLMEIRVVADAAWNNLNIHVYFDNNPSAEINSGNLTEPAASWFIYKTKLFVPKNTDVRVSMERDVGSGSGAIVVTWLNVGHSGGAPPAP